jgi:hypothetical protein
VHRYNRLQLSHVLLLPRRLLLLLLCLLVAMVHAPEAAAHQPGVDSSVL